MNKLWPVSNPGHHGFGHWLTTQAEASVTMSNCGCFPVDHPNGPGPKPPSGYANILPHGDECVVGGGRPSDWCYPCTNYFGPDAPSGVAPSTGKPGDVLALGTKIPDDDSEFIMDHFETFLRQTVAEERPFLAHLCLHAIHEPHPASPRFYEQ